MVVNYKLKVPHQAILQYAEAENKVTGYRNSKNTDEILHNVTVIINNRLRGRCP